MKAGLLTVAALTATATAQVHRRHAHQHQHKGREAVEAVEYETAHAPHAVVYVDQNGKPISTAYGNAPAETPAAYQAPAAPAAASPAENKPASYGGDKANKLGIVYSPYRDAGGCKDQGEVSKDFEKFADYSFVRIYGTDCEQVSTVLTAAKAKNMKIMAGIFDITQVQAEAQKIIDAVKGDWSAIDTVSIGNELVNAGTKSPGEVVAAVNQGRGILRGAGFKGDVVTVDTFVAMIAHPELCQASDHAAANCHAFFDGGRTAEQAGEFVKEQAERVKQACGGKKTVITESGWPHTGASNGAAVPSKENQQKAIASLKSKFTEGLVLFTAFDDIWKKNTAATYGAEQYWGFL